MNEAVFISDLHLHPYQPDMMDKFSQFIAWAAQNTRTLYILGDFLHVWSGDDDLNEWGRDIVSLLANLSAQGIQVYFMTGNRDFLIGETFLNQAKMQYLPDPTIISLGKDRVLLSHGDRYCTQDYAHQCFRRITTCRWLRTLFLRLPHSLRQSIVGSVRNYSQQNTQKSPLIMQTVPKSMFIDIHAYHADLLIHGHTHQPGVRTHQNAKKIWQEYTLSDWDENPSILCYNKSIYQFIKIFGDR